MGDSTTAATAPVTAHVDVGESEISVEPDAKGVTYSVDVPGEDVVLLRLVPVASVEDSGTS